MSKRTATLAHPTERVRLRKTSGSAPSVRRDGGAYGAGLIQKVSVATSGEALGHGMWLDDVTLQQIAAAGNAAAAGLKSRWTHPDMSGDGLGKLTSRLRKFRVDGEQVYADQHFLRIGHTSPDGDLASYQMDLAEEDPTGYGLSIVFERDKGEMSRFEAEHTDADGNFRSPDERNLNNFPHVRLKKLWAADAVDEPAANPSGLFSREQDLASEASALCAFALGLSNEPPTTIQLGLDAERVRSFATRFLSTHNLQVTTMADDAKKSPAADGLPAVELSNLPAEAPVALEKTPVADGAPTEKYAEARAEMTRYQKAFGEKGLEYFAAGKSFEEAQAEHASELNKGLEDRVAKLETQLAAEGRVNGEAAPVGFQAGDEKPAKKGFAGKIRIAGAAPQK
jgi:hypothetical protein